MSFHNVTFPDRIMYNSEFGPTFDTIIVANPSRREERVPILQTAQHRLEINLNGLTLNDLYAVKEFFMLRRGSAFGFRARDRMDYNTSARGRNAEDQNGTDPTATDQLIGVGDGSTTVFQLQKRYSDGVAPNIVRTIQLPRADTVQIAVDGVELDPADFSVDDLTGLVTLDTAAPNLEEVTWGGEFDVPVRATQDVEQFLGMSIKDYDDGELPIISCIEIFNEIAGISDFYPGGANAFEFGTDTLISLGSGRVKTVSATTTGLGLGLPAKADLPRGADYFVINVDAGSDDFNLLDSDDDSIIVALSGGDKVIVSLGLNLAMEEKWIAVG